MQLPESVMHAARDYATARGSPFIGTEHVLMGLYSQPLGPARRALTICGASEEALKLKIEKLLCGLSSMDKKSGELPLVPRVKKALDHAAIEARARGQVEVSPEHLLLGMLADNETVATQLLLNMGVDLSLLTETLVNEAGWP